MTGPVLFSTAEHIARLSINRPERLNALDMSTAESMLRSVDVAAEQARSGQVRVLVLAGEGRRAFSAGADLRARSQMAPAEQTRHLDLIARLCRAIHRFPAPVIAEINGHCLGGGLEMAVAADIRIASATSTFAFPEVKLGIFPGSGGPVFARRFLSHGALSELLFTGAPIDARRAAETGLVDRVLADGDAVSAETAKIAGAIASAAPCAVRSLKRLLLSTESSSLEESLDEADRLRHPLDATADHHEGMAAFAEKRVPVFRGR